MKKAVSIFSIFLSIAVYAATPGADFSGTWTFDPAQSKNVGMMAQGKIQSVVSQSGIRIVVDDNSVFNGQADTQHTVYDLTGKPIANVSMMAGRATTRTRWNGTQLITEWESAGAIAGTVVRRTEKRYLSSDRKTMYVESTAAGREPMVIVFTRAR